MKITILSIYGAGLGLAAILAACGSDETTAATAAGTTAAGSTSGATTGGGGDTSASTSATSGGGGDTTSSVSAGGAGGAGPGAGGSGNPEGCPPTAPMMGDDCEGMMGPPEPCLYDELACFCGFGDNWQCSDTSDCPPQPPEDNSDCDMQGLFCPYADQTCACFGGGNPEWNCFGGN